MIYFDNAATTEITPNVLQVMQPFLTSNYGNSSSLYSLGKISNDAIIQSREKIAKSINANPSEIYFTSCGSESDNWALRGVCEVQKLNGKNKIITSNIEHHAVLNTCKCLEKQGFEIVYIPVNKEGVLNLEFLKREIDDKTAIVSIMTANNEVGTIQPIEEIGNICKEYDIIFHTDAVQAVGHIPIDVGKMNIDLLSCSGHKLHAPKGIGFLYIKNGIEVNNLIYGGQQESGKRAGTENVASIVGMAEAVSSAIINMDKNNEHNKKIQDYLIESLSHIQNCKINGSLTNRLSGNISVSFKDIEGESLTLLLDNTGICVSSGSACDSKSIASSHVLRALNIDKRYINGTIRLSFNELNTLDEAKKVILEIKKILNMLISLSSL